MYRQMIDLKRVICDRNVICIYDFWLKLHDTNISYLVVSGITGNVLVGVSM